MTKETPEVTRFSLYELVRVVYTERKESSIIVRQEPEAVFDDKDALDAYVKASNMVLVDNPSEVPKTMPTEVRGFVRGGWRDGEKPTAKDFAVPFNPIVGLGGVSEGGSGGDGIKGSVLSALVGGGAGESDGGQEASKSL